MKEIEDLVLNELRKDFSPEFINRIDETIVFDPLSHVELARICRLLIPGPERHDRQQGAFIDVDEAAVEWLLEHTGDDPIWEPGRSGAPSRSTSSMRFRSFSIAARDERIEAIEVRVGERTGRWDRESPSRSGREPSPLRPKALRAAGSPWPCGVVVSGQTARSLPDPGGGFDAGQALVVDRWHRVVGTSPLRPNDRPLSGIKFGEPYVPEKIRSTFQALWDVGLSRCRLPRPYQPLLASRSS